MSSAAGHGLHALGDRAYRFLAARGPVTQEALLTHVYGGPPPPGLVAHLAAPLLEDPRLERRADGRWSAIGPAQRRQDVPVDGLELTTLALVASGPSPERGRLVRLCAVHVRNGTTTEHFEVTLNPGRRVPRYVTERIGLAPELLDELPPFSAVLDDLVRFLRDRPVLAQDARLSWAFVNAEARRAGRVLAEPLLIDANELFGRAVKLKGKPSLALVAAQLGIGTVSITRPEEEARVLALLAGPLLVKTDVDRRMILESSDQRPALRRGHTARSQPDEPGVYVLRDAEQAALYVGKARRLRSRLGAYINRPLGITRRLEGLVGSVEAVDSTVCATDLEALVLEDREIRRLQPRYNTARRQRTPRVWIRLPPLREARAGKRQPAQRRLEPSLGPAEANGEFVGPFRNETLAERARLLARAVFELDTLRGGDPHLYEQQLGLAWQFLHVGGQSEAAEACGRRRSARLLRDVLAFDPTALLLPADPRQARYVVVRPGPSGIEGYVLDRGVFRAWGVVGEDMHVSQFAAELLTPAEPRTTPEDIDVVLRWFGAQRPPALLVLVPDDSLAAVDAIEGAALALLHASPAGVEDPLDALG